MKTIIYYLAGILFILKPYYAQSNQTKFYAVNIKSLNTFQTWDIKDGNKLHQLSNQFIININPGRYTAININSSYSNSEVESKTLSGLSDIQFQISQKFKDINTVIEAGVNIPSGKESLSNSELSSTILLSRDIFNFRNSVLGQGTNMFFGATWAAELQDNLVFGAGLSYQIRGEYSPLAEQSSKYKPSDELLVSLGVDYRIDKSKTISGDVVGVFFKEDEVNGEVVFGAGNRFIYSTAYRQYFNDNILIVNARYRFSAEDEIKNLIATTNEKFTSNYFMLSASYYHSVSRKVSIRYLLETKLFEKTLKQFSGYSSYSPEVIFYFELSKHFQIPIHIKYILGQNDSNTINGIDTGIGFNLNL